MPQDYDKSQITETWIPVPLLLFSERKTRRHKLNANLFSEILTNINPTSLMSIKLDLEYPYNSSSDFPSYLKVTNKYMGIIIDKLAECQKIEKISLGIT